jgi:hypothetical protein
MAEYKSFHYLMHSTPEAPPAHYVSTPLPLSFHELYTPRQSTVESTKDRLKLFDSKEKSFWRTRDRIVFTFYEDVDGKYLCVTCHNPEKQETYRTIFLNLEVLYFEIEAKARGDRTPLTRKKDRRFDNVTMPKQVVDYVMTRLNIGQVPLPWPSRSSPCDPLVQQGESGGNVEYHERMCTFDKLSSDEWESMEITPPAGISFDGIEHVKLSPTIPVDLQAPLTTNETTSAVTATSPSPSESVAAPAPLPVTQTTKLNAKPKTSSNATSAPNSATKIAKKPSGGNTNRKKVVPIG